jgi:hypothetical protein
MGSVAGNCYWKSLDFRPELPEITPSSTGQPPTRSRASVRRKSGLGPSGALAPSAISLCSTLSRYLSVSLSPILPLDLCLGSMTRKGKGIRRKERKEKKEQEGKIRRKGVV